MAIDPQFPTPPSERVASHAFGAYVYQSTSLGGALSSVDLSELEGLDESEIQYLLWNLADQGAGQDDDS